VFGKRTRNPKIFQAPIFWSVCLGLVFTVVFYKLLNLNPERMALLYRYATCHEVAYVSVAFFFTALCALIYKFLESLKQERLTSQCESVVEDIKIARSTESFDEESSQLSWLEAVWKSQTVAIYTSGVGSRVRELLGVQNRRRTFSHLDQDLKNSEEFYADEQHDSYAMIRIITWAMPMLGFLGTVIGISATLGQMDASKLASGSQEAMNDLTKGLYVAFDTTAVGLVLTMMVMFLQFTVNKAELKLLQRMNRLIEDLFGSCLMMTPQTAQLPGVDTAFEHMTRRLMGTVEKLIKKQSELWQSSLEQIQSRWVSLGNETQASLNRSVAESITNAQQSVHEPVLALHKQVAVSQSEMVDKQAEAIEQFHAAQLSCLAQLRADVFAFQSKLSDQIQASLDQQESLQQLTKRILDLSENASVISSMDEPIQRVLHRMTDIDRFHDAAICLTEAVAVLGTQLERHGYIGRTAARRRAEEVAEDSTVESNVIPLRRKAG
jgi:biopolymer transport protein ExbB/TolQ